jgi:hypothetical protein
MVVGIRNVFMMMFLNQTLLGRGTSEKAESNESSFALSHRRHLLPHHHLCHLSITIFIIIAITKQPDTALPGGQRILLAAFVSLLVMPSL